MSERACMHVCDRGGGGGRREIRLEEIWKGGEGCVCNHKVLGGGGGDWKKEKTWKGLCALGMGCWKK